MNDVELATAFGYQNISLIEKNGISEDMIISDISDGARKKLWIQKDSELYVYKESRLHTGGEYTKEHIAEYLAMLIARTLNIECVDIVLLNNAILSKKMYDVELKSFLDYSEELSHSFHMSNLSTYCISTLLSEKNQYRDQIIQMLLFDALIGNSDRHPGNYYYSEEYGFYPLFDNGSSLCAFIEEQTIPDILRDSKRFISICETKSKPTLRDDQRITQHQLVNILREQYPVQFRDFQNRLSPMILQVVTAVDVSDSYVELLQKFLVHRLEWFYE